MQLRAVGMTDVGLVRSENQDAFTIQIAPCSENRNSLLAVVADGVGGGMAGNVASLIAVEALAEIYRENESSPREIMHRAITTANERINERSDKDAQCRGMATTCTALMVKGNAVIIGHIGDSRAYRIRDGEIELLTEDHTLPRRLFREGLIAEEEIEAHPSGNVLTNALGSRNAAEVDIRSYEILENDSYILCSDGMYKHVKDYEILNFVNSTELEKIPELFVKLAKERGGDDNITVVVVQSSEDILYDKTTEIVGNYVDTGTKLKRIRYRVWIFGLIAVVIAIVMLTKMR